VRRVPPDALSVAGVLVAGAATAVAASGGRWPLAAATLVLLAGVLDGLDGAVALHTGRARPLGAVVDAVADRAGDLLLVATLAVLGAPPAWCVAAGALTLLHEYLRARANAAGMPGVGAVTVAERPTRLIIVALACLGAGLRPHDLPVTGWNRGTVFVVVWLAVGVVGFVHLCIAVVRTTPRRFPSGGADQVGDDLRRQGDDREPAAGMRRPADEEEPRHR
jgi:CDP-diacylglycerol--glycerol-3-phosphate 3-phosphatidyltransferase